jgi:DNA invertase Pin-like site-specific DNA recombinase
MMRDIEAGEINCVIIKDFSRLGRNYIEVGELTDNIFPKYKTRLISINDRYDSLNPRSDADDIIIPFKHLIDEHYLRESSIKIRSSLNMKRKNGDFVAAFAPYGYKRDEENKSRLVIDDHAAEVVQSIFRMKIEGKSGQKIAGYLNEIGEPSPSEHKKKETNYKAQFQTKTRALWSAVAVSRILRNPVYIGTLIQGKETTPSYKVKRRIKKPEDEWHVATDTHEPIIHHNDFEIVQSLLSQDTRAAPKSEIVYPLSGLVYCADCCNNMIRTKSDRLFYYICASSRGKNKSCTSHCIQQLKLESAVMEAIVHQINYALDIHKSIEYVQSLPRQKRNVAKLNNQISEREKEIKTCEGYKRSLYEDYKNGIISKEDYVDFGKDYTLRINELKQAVIRLREESELLLNNDTAMAHNPILSDFECQKAPLCVQNCSKRMVMHHCHTTALGWLEHYTGNKSIPELSRQLVVSLIKRIEIMEGKRVSIAFRFQDKFETAWSIIKDFTTEETRCV